MGGHDPSIFNLTEVRAAQVTVEEDRSRNIRVRERTSAQVHMREIGTTKERPVEVLPAQITRRGENTTGAIDSTPVLRRVSCARPDEQFQNLDDVIERERIAICRILRREQILDLEILELQCLREIERPPFGLAEFLGHSLDGLAEKTRIQHALRLTVGSELAVDVFLGQASVDLDGRTKRLILGV